MNIHRLYRVLLRPFRERRLRRFAAIFSPAPGTRILDVGGTSFNWSLIPCPAQVTLLNLDPAVNRAELPRNMTAVQGDGTVLKYAAREFDIGFSNSVIEHLGTLERQRQFADEIRRVSKQVWVQTPARTFFLEPHLLTPLVHFLPKNLQRKVVRNFTVWGWITQPSADQVDAFLSETRLLSFQEMQSLFPDCEVLRERFLGWTKAYIAVRR